MSQETEFQARARIAGSKMESIFFQANDQPNPLTREGATKGWDAVGAEVIRLLDDNWNTALVEVVRACGELRK